MFSTTDHSFLLRHIPAWGLLTPSPASPSRPQPRASAFSQQPVLSFGWLTSSVFHLWPFLLTRHTLRSRLFHYPGVSHHLKRDNSWIFFNCPLGPSPVLQTLTLPSFKCSKLNMSRRNSASCWPHCACSSSVDGIKLCSSACKFS